ncbi:MAG TPA: hypothetical protein VLC53_13070, partial [Myxococcota bacterium]|nr:hypothetical protein [Myxococcota bacterium]
MARLGTTLLGISALALGAWLVQGEPTALLAASADGRGLGRFAVFSLAAFAASLASEDLTCIGVGVLVAAGQVPLDIGIAACGIALFAGDLLLYAAGRFTGAPLLARTPLSTLVAAGRRAAMHRAVGPGVLIASRFLPGTRLPTYV